MARYLYHPKNSSQWFWYMVWFIVLSCVLILLFRPDYMIVPPSVHALSEKDPTPPDPNRPYYDIYSNKFSFDGKLLHANCPDTDPITHQNNPYCPSTEPVVPKFVGGK
ncbi:MAG: hypothetical protein EPO02_13525 [Nitrospirae bacterium]|nr:MAG: hypothetical protein EPO02_13525 [Nitrospirota bacterium]